MKRFLVAHDYGMGSLWWWIEAPSEAAIVQTYAEVVVVDQTEVDPGRFTDIPSIRIGDPAPAGLDDLQAQRRLQRANPKFGALVGRGNVYIKQEFPEDQETYFVEYDEKGYRTRQVVVSASGDAESTGPQDWCFNPPEDLWDPELAERETTREAFESWWARARAAGRLAP